MILIDASKSWKGAVVFLCIALILDQLTKQLIRLGIWSFDLGFVKSTLTYNTGTLWSLFSGPGANIFFIIFSFIVLTVVAILAKKSPHFRLPFALVFAGGLGNLIDRILFGGVVDFINLGWWPIFNLADSYLMIGIAWIAVRILLEDTPKKTRTKKKIKL